jgi:2-amino-4-hydroxy-6-hydroxymethyldihydropteridine diphosphokinase
MRYWLALGSNSQAQFSLDFAAAELAKLGDVLLSQRYDMPPRSGVGVDYVNMAVRLDSDLTTDAIRSTIVDIEDRAGRVRRSNVIRLDIDLIAWAEYGQLPVFDHHRLPLPMDVIVPMEDVWEGFGQVLDTLSTLAQAD